MNQLHSSPFDPDGIRTDHAAKRHAHTELVRGGREMRPVKHPAQRAKRSFSAQTIIAKIHTALPQPRWVKMLLPTNNATKALRNHALALGAVLAVPTLAAPGDFGALAGSARSEASYTTQGERTAPMGFELPGMSFPGSAFYFLADPPSDGLVALPSKDAHAVGTEAAGYHLGEAISVGPAASPFFSPAGSDYLRAKQCLAQAIWYEAANESEAGQRAVAQVVLNRVSHASWPSSVCGVVYQGAERRTGCQFTFTCDGSLARKARGIAWERARSLAAEALSGSVYAPIGHATHYHTIWVSPYWADELDHIGTIGAHLFYRNRGAAGDRGAFTDIYDGTEPVVAQLDGEKTDLRGASPS